MSNAALSGSGPAVSSKNRLPTMSEAFPTDKLNPLTTAPLAAAAWIFVFHPPRLPYRLSAVF
jgi:hypothetical protein